MQSSNVVVSSLGEIFDLTIFAEDHNGNSKDAVYSYSRYPIIYPSNVIVVDLDPAEDILSSFASVNRMMTNQRYPIQQFALVMRNADLLQKCKENFQNTYNFSSYFVLSLIDSSNGAVVCYYAC